MPLQIQYVSDLHLEFSENRGYLAKNPIPPTAPILVMAGDITLFSQIEESMYYFEKISKQYETIYWLPGNHEYYHYDLAKKEGSFCEAILPNLYLVNDFSFIHNNCKLIFTALWSHISEQYKTDVVNGLNDFNLITYNGQKLTADIYNAQHQKSLAFIKHEIAISKCAHNLVFTHHVPTFTNIPEKYNGNPTNEAYWVELADYITQNNIYSWVSGHSHENIADFTLGKTKILTNQLCYVKWNEQGAFRAEKFLEVI